MMVRYGVQDIGYHEVSDNLTEGDYILEKIPLITNMRGQYV